MNPESVDAKIIRGIAKKVWDSREQIIDLEGWCERLLRKYLPNINDWEICEVLEDIVRKVNFYIRREITRCREKGITPRYEFSGVGNFLYRVRDIRVEEIKSRIKNISWKDFEDLCKHLLEINGIEMVEIPRKSKDGGIDFYGLLRMHKIY